MIEKSVRKLFGVTIVLLMAGSHSGHIGLLSEVYGQPAAAAEQVKQIELPFWDSADVQDVLGPVRFRTEPLTKEGLAEGYPAMLFGCDVPEDDAATLVYGWKLTGWDQKATRTVEVLRTRTRDGRVFTDTETVLSLTNPDWQGFVNIVRRPTDGQLFFFCWDAGRLQVWSSADGKKWDQLTKSAYVDHDAMNVIWYPPFQQFLNFQNTLQKHSKRYPDNIGEYRRVLSFRRSSDGVQWEWFSPPFLKDARYWTPDAEDPIDLEFYRSVVFPTKGRYVMLLQNYIAPPPEANSRRQTTKHGPRSEAEWAISRDGLNWSRPFRDEDATAQVSALAVQGPLKHDGVLRFYERDRVITGIREDRMFYATGRGNCEFSTPDFRMPPAGLSLNAKLLYQDGEGPTGRSYLMAELRDANNRVISGYERQRCLFENTDSAALPLRWDDRSGSELAGQTVRVRLFFRDARIYSISENSEGSRNP